MVVETARYNAFNVLAQTIKLIADG